MSQLASPKALWRAAANDSMEGSGDFPEAIVMLIEVLNGPKGSPTKHKLIYTINTDGTTTLCITDDGDGMDIAEGLNRFLTWASEDSVDMYSKNGHGTKKFLAKHGPYEMPWSVETRTIYPGPITRYSGPWNGRLTKIGYSITELPDFPLTGFRINLTCATSILFNPGEKPDANLLSSRIKEVICTRKAQSVLDRINYCVRVVDNTSAEPVVVEENSHTAGWRSFKETLEALAKEPAFAGVEKLLEEEHPLKDGLSFVRFTTFTTCLKTIEHFPVYSSHTGDKLFRVHMFNHDTMIEAANPLELTGRGRHPYTHFVTFAECLPVDGTNVDHINALPTPATTKVSYRRECSIFQSVLRIYKEMHSEIIGLMKTRGITQMRARMGRCTPASASVATAKATSVRGASRSATRDSPPASAHVPVPAVGGDGTSVGRDGTAVGGDGTAVGGDGTAVGGDGTAVGPNCTAAAGAPLPASPAWTPVPIEDLDAGHIRAFSKKIADEACDHYEIPTTLLLADKKHLLTGLTISGADIMKRLRTIDLDRNPRLKAYIHYALMKF